MIKPRWFVCRKDIQRQGRETRIFEERGYLIEYPCFVVLAKFRVSLHELGKHLFIDQTLGDMCRMRIVPILHLLPRLHWPLRLRR